MQYSRLRTRLGAQLQAARKQAGYSQQEMARRSHITRQHLQRLESGIGNPTMETLFNIAEAAGRRLSDLVKDAEEPVSRAQGNARRAS